ncbi:hypothetical protein [Sphingomonas fennica]|uniref:hypothetical protein n=1 Tax=Edaphosphingomonas fennica TaxID=114404 RepID=UPI0011B20C07|nr:hypothetical protein [Sphingomonas fennica]
MNHIQFVTAKVRETETARRRETAIFGSLCIEIGDKITCHPPRTIVALRSEKFALPRKRASSMLKHIHFVSR